MSVFKTTELLSQLKNEVHQVIDTVQQLPKADNAWLNKKPAAGKWSIAQILEHLNTYNRYYLPLISGSMPQAKMKGSKAKYKSGWLGDYFAKSMYSEVVTAKKITNKMSAMKGHIPAAEIDGAQAIDEFIADQKQLLQLLDAAANADMSSVKIPVTISKLIRIRLGDTFRFLIAHQVRHMLQLNNVLGATGK